ncbi:polysaccharide biosynthesis protein, partial [Clostridium perfringens]|nr:polysaccharide biosynthesis protein [Clostridium perfringens]
IYMGIGIMLSKYVISLFIDFDKLSLILGIAILLVIIAIGAFMYLHAIIILGGIKKADIEEISPKLLRVMPKFLRKNIK